jgi:hypothetical protein
MTFWKPGISMDTARPAWLFVKNIPGKWAGRGNTIQADRGGYESYNTSPPEDGSPSRPRPGLISGFSGGKKNINFFFGQNIARVKIVL